MTIPNLPISQLLDEQKRDLHPDWKFFFNELTRALQQNLSDEGLQSPLQSTSNIVLLNGQQSNGRYLYNTQTHKGMVCENGIFKTIMTQT